MKIHGHLEINDWLREQAEDKSHSISEIEEKEKSLDKLRELFNSLQARENIADGIKPFTEEQQFDQEMEDFEGFDAKNYKRKKFFLFNTFFRKALIF